MLITVVGCSGSYPGPDSPASCYLLEAEGPAADGQGTRTWRVLIDLGNGALGALHRYADPLSIDAVWLSHLHADHCLDLCGYHVLRRYHPSGQAPRIPVWGPAGTAARMARAYDLPEDPGMREDFDFFEWDGAMEFGPFRVEPIAVVHPVPAYALRVSAGGRTMTYSGDTGQCPALDEAARDVDLFLSEASFEEGRPNPPDIHLTGREAGLTATRAQAARLVLTHVPPWHDAQVVLAEAQAVYDGPVELAVPGAVYRL